MLAFPATGPLAVPRLLAAAGVFALAGLGYLLHGALPGADDLGRLRAIPLEQRRTYREQLREFDRLPYAERRAIEELDRRIRELPPEERDRYLATLHGYSLWLRAQPPERRAELDGLEVDDRLVRLRLYWAEGRAVRDQGSTAVFLQSIALSPLGLVESAQLLRAWFAISPEERRNVQAVKPLDARLQQLKARAVQLQIDPDPGPIRDLLEALKDQAPPELAMLKGRLVPGLELQGQELARFRRAEAWYFVNHEPRMLPPAERTRFEAVLPDWLLDTTVSLPADVAQRRLGILYELVFGTEGMPAGLKPDPRPRPAPTPSSRPSGRPSAPVVPL